MFDAWTALDSTNIQAIQYDQNTHILQVRFAGGRVYAYDSVPEDTVTALAHSSSPGRFFLEHIKDEFDSWKV